MFNYLKNMSLAQGASSFCLFCYNPISSCGDSADNFKNIKSFTTNLFRFVRGRDCEQSAKLIEENLIEFRKNSECLNCCEECQVIIDQFLQIYHQLKCLELQLDLKLDNLLGKIEVSSRVPKRWENVRKIMERSRMESSLGTIERSQYLILKIRQLIKKTGVERSGSSFPRVLVERHNNCILPVQSMVSKTANDETMNKNTNEANTTRDDDDPVIKIENEDSQSENSESETSISKEHPTSSSSKLNHLDKICEVCHKKCATDQQLELHFKTCHDLTNVSNEDEIHRCKATQCNAYFLTKNQLHIHNLQKHHKTKKLATLSVEYIDGVKYFLCKRCKRPFSQIYLLKRHMTTTSCGKEADDNQGTPVKCTECKETFDKNEDLWIHQNQAHYNYKKRVCPKCGKCFNRKYTFELHLEYHKGPAEWKWKCVYCSKKFVSETQLKIHVAAHKTNNTGLKRKQKASGEHTENCVVDRVVTEQKDSGEHAEMTKNTSKTINCTECGAKFRKEQSFRIHQNKVHSIQVCKHCGKIFAAKLDLKSHLESHRDPQVWKWQCKQCGRRCVSEYKLNEHMRSHTGEKPYSCHLCKATFAYAQPMRRHLRGKHGVLDVEPVIGRPKVKIGDSFPCHFCGKSLASRPNLIKHCKSQHGNEIEKINQDDADGNENDECNMEQSDNLEDPLEMASDSQSFPILDEIY